MKPVDRLIVALDFREATKAYQLTTQLAGIVTWVKVGSVLFSSAGRGLVKELVNDGWNVFLDLKLHDVPHQVDLTVRALSDLGVRLATVHTSGGAPMMEAAAKAAGEASRGELSLLGVTVLTSMESTELASIGVSGTPEETVLLRAKLAQESGLSGIVASPLEANQVRRMVGDSFEIVTPGIRPAGVHRHDQKRVATPAEAIAAGASRIVVGRAITDAADPAAAATTILESLK